MIKKKNDKTVKIIILLSIVVVLAIILCILHIIKTLSSNNLISIPNPHIEQQIKEETNNFTIEEILENYGCKVISYSIDGDENKYYKIYLKFKYPLYYANESKEDYFVELVEILYKRVNRPLKLIDEDRNIEIYYDSSNGIFEINEIEDFFENNSYLEVKNHIPTKPIQAFRSSVELNKIISNSWSRNKLKIEQEPNEIDDEWIYYDGYKFNYSDININYIIFTEDYKEAVLEEIEVGEKFTEIKEKLGNPTYTNSNKMIGYKTSDGYAFFYEDCIVLYPCIDYRNIEFEELVTSYYYGEYEGYRTNFVLDIKNDYKDFKSELTEDGVKLFSPSRGIELFLDNDGKMDITIYNNYNICSLISKLAETNRVDLKLDTDAIYLYEIERYSK
ncbi:MAG: hypothetical protein J6J60_06800 [Clostridia bacterium]|nr:hypothetical protein [Clostridia bacterium]